MNTTICKAAWRFPLLGDLCEYSILTPEGTIYTLSLFGRSRGGATSRIGCLIHEQANTPPHEIVLTNEELALWKDACVADDAGNRIASSRSFEGRGDPGILAVRAEADAQYRKNREEGRQQQVRDSDREHRLRVEQDRVGPAMACNDHDGL